MFKRKKLAAVLVTVFILFFSVIGIVFHNNYTAPVLMYHSVFPDAPAENRLAVSVNAFERQMRFLKIHNYNVVPLESLSVLIKKKKKIPAKTVAITFDDGYKDNYTHAFPILKKYNLCATIFVIIEEIGRPQADRLSWSEIKAMQNSGIITFGSHCIGPQPLTEIESDRQLHRQIFDSKKILEEKIGKSVSAFSYPEGRFNEKIKKMVIEAGYKLAVTTNPGKNYPDDDIFALKRIRISSTSENLFVYWVESSGYYNFMREHRHK